VDRIQIAMKRMAAVVDSFRAKQSQPAQ